MPRGGALDERRKVLGGLDFQLRQIRTRPRGSVKRRRKLERARPAGSMNILIVEDDGDIAAHVGAELGARGMTVAHARDGRTGLAMSRTGAYDVLVLDRMLPGLDGLSLLSTLRAEGLATPALFLTCLSGVDDRVEGLAAGGDDYLVKPFATAELCARIAALARRPTLGAATPTRLAAADIRMDLIARTVTRGEREIDLQPREFQLLEYFLRNVGKVVTRKMLLEHVWSYDFDPRTNIVETHVSRLRSKLDGNSRGES
jgi:two-component system, OmpR family, response regulator